MIDVEPRASIHHEFTAHLKEIRWIVNATLVVVHFKIDGNKISLLSLRGVPASKHTIGERTTRRSIDAHDENDGDDDDDDDSDDEGEPRTYIRRRSSYNLFVGSVPYTTRGPTRQSMYRTRAILTRIPFSEPAWQKRGRASRTCSKRLMHPCACPTAKVSVLLFHNVGAAAARVCSPPGQSLLGPNWLLPSSSTFLRFNLITFNF